MQEGFEKKVLGGKNVANVGVLPVPMLPMANGAGLRARRPAGDLRAWKPATPNEARHPECGRAYRMRAGIPNEGGRGECFLATKNAKSAKVG